MAFISKVIALKKHANDDGVDEYDDCCIQGNVYNVPAAIMEGDDDDDDGGYDYAPAA
ncbi:hypothetical protein Fmac_012764 [Flemingia macrophylla]|uniref:Uncharacterized protein n=1 Tax=Flemingia macrophylla TaxID=520843 RepID=A0ABD1MRA3_9FABA